MLITPSLEPEKIVDSKGDGIPISAEVVQKIGAECARKVRYGSRLSEGASSDCKSQTFMVWSSEADTSELTCGNISMPLIESKCDLRVHLVDIITFLSLPPPVVEIPDLPRILLLFSRF